ncbi:hypothetical protein [Clostridium sp.]|uniref:hypothetical protein n=1 Tax=Clostridium sp. TaxID=1506 RepID=UPI003995F321
MEETLKLILEGINVIQEEMKEIKKDVTGLKNEITDIKDSLNHVEIQLAQNIDLTTKVQNEMAELYTVKQVAYQTAYKVSVLESKLN